MNLATFKKFTLAGFILLTAFTFNSCKKNPVPLPEGQLKLTEYVSGQDYIRLAYNGAGEISRITMSSHQYSIGEEVTYNVSYLQDKKIKELTGKNRIRIALTYEGSQLVKSAVYYGKEQAYETDYGYVDNSLRSITIKLVDKNAVTPIIKFLTYFDETGNPTTIDKYLVNPLTGQFQPAGFVIKKYDNKPNPFAGCKDLMMVLLQPISRNNVTREDYFDTDVHPQETIEKTYFYNLNQLPVKATVKETSPGKEQAVVTAIYSYK